ncbi:MAG: hypothetical protein ACNA78_00930 [Balneolaceae bacterium]
MKKRVWQLSLVSFIIAAFTGVLYRYGMFYPLPEGISFANIRHAHSHLMFFNWVSPPIMAWMAVAGAGRQSREGLRPYAYCLYTMLALGFLSFPFFLMYGYQSVAIGTSQLPLAAIISGLVMLTWYWFALLWMRQKGERDSNLGFLFFDAALLALVISSLGAWGVSVFQFTDIDNPLVSSALTHFFLGVFTEGWVVLGILGLLWQKAERPNLPFKTGWLWMPLLFGSLLIFPFSLNPSVITPAMHITANVGLVLIAISLALNVWLMKRENLLKGAVMKTVGVLLLLKILFQLLAVLPIGIWPGEHGLRVLYLHLLLLGIASLVLLEVYHARRDKWPKAIFTVSVVIVLITLTFISGYWPASLMVPSVYHWVLAAAVVPGLAAVWLFLTTLRRKW